MRLRRVLVVIACAASAACATLLDLQPPPPESDASGTFDAATNDVSVPDTGGVVCAALDAALPGDDAGTVFHPFNNGLVDDAGTSAWMFFDTSTISGGASDYSGGTFDGHYLYFAPAADGDFVRFDTTVSPFDSKNGWTTVPQASLGLKMSFRGTVFDGRYVYYVPNYNNAVAAYSGIVVRFDTTVTSFGATSAWTTFNTQLIAVPDGGVPARGFFGGVFDGRYVYLSPDDNGVARDGRAARYDTASDSGPTPVDAGDASLATFSNVSAWLTFDIAGVNASALGFTGGVFDGHYVYLTPYANGIANNGGYSPFAARYDTFDTTQGFTASSSWTTFEVDQVNGDGYGFIGAAFDGTYVYLVPFAETSVARYNTNSSFDEDSAWSVFDVSQIVHVDGGQPRFGNAAFDGRFIYLLPDLPGLGVVLRYDTLSTFTSLCAWSTDDVSHYNAQATQFNGAVYDGRYLYLVPSLSTFARFDTKTPQHMPSLPAFSGSFY
jgi:hypothetical protein